MGQTIILTQISFLTILALIGFFSSKIGVIRAETRDALVKVIFNITLPLLLFTNFSVLDLTSEILNNSLIVIALSLLVMLLMLLAGYLSSGLFRVDHKQKSVFIVHHAFGNILYFGFPVIDALFGELGLFYASIYAFVSIMLVWTVGVYIITRNGKMSLRDSFRKMVNPNSVAILAGFILFLFQIKLPDLLLNPFKSLGGTTIYLSMLYIGAMLGLIKLKGILSNSMVYLTALNKNIIFPILLIIVFSFTGKALFDGIDKMILSVIILEAAMPCMANIVIVAKIFNVDDKLATANVFISTVLSIVSLPFIWYIMSLLM
ncbi:MAG: AEC family transporter [Bacteroidales bacterium]|nr:AEC family transporter [Bacteroidales bacterium]